MQLDSGSTGMPSGAILLSRSSCNVLFRFSGNPHRVFGLRPQRSPSGAHTGTLKLREPLKYPLKEPLKDPLTEPLKEPLKDPLKYPYGLMGTLVVALKVAL